VRNGLLEVLPGVGTVVARSSHASAADRAALLSTQVEQLVVEALRLGVDEHTVQQAITARWRELSRADRTNPSPTDAHE
jgi:GntR family transcriptional regulator